MIFDEKILVESGDKQPIGWTDTRDSIMNLRKGTCLVMRGSFVKEPCSISERFVASELIVKRNMSEELIHKN
jgi:hypothetical protein